MNSYNTFFNNAVSITVRTAYFMEIFKNSKNLDCSAILINNKDKIQLKDKIAVAIQTSLESPYNTHYIANKIYVDKNSAIINEFEENNTTLFLLPLLQIDPRILLLKTNFINGYVLCNENKDEIGNYIYAVYRYMPFSQYRNLITLFKKQTNFLALQKSKDNRFDIVKFLIPEKFKKSTKLIIDGRYSEIPKSVKQTIIQFKKRGSDDIISQTLFNSDKLRENLAYSLGIRVSDLPKELREKPKLKLETWK